jgi:hypothetical protein
MTVWNGDRINGHKVETTFSATGWARQDDGSLAVDFATATREQMACLKSVDIDQRTIDGAAAGVCKIKIGMSDKRQAFIPTMPSSVRKPTASRTIVDWTTKRLEIGMIGDVPQM